LEAKAKQLNDDIDDC
jgi:dynein heavy chain, axonemal